ncbi:hypothetical protein [Dictyobacter arantiisoli]|uniref:PEGA domain-containing protein n=1 Tax=Dictyobacter arantiisoli TaxID=2014874 RepID=A0A5A5T7I3_9CHLR|nr:hypothetical protein [Dictyobacter arantiisoli]GCF06963.1 hypothetical protein KDI_05270 [Dictyobacter arantiisoli]
MEQANIRIERRPSTSGILRSYKVYVDGQQVGKLRESEQLAVPVQPGDHVIVLRVDWCSSHPVTVHVEAGEEVPLYGQSISGIIAGLYTLIFNPQNYIQVFSH